MRMRLDKSWHDRTFAPPVDDLHTISGKRLARSSNRCDAIVSHENFTLKRIISRAIKNIDSREKDVGHQLVPLIAASVSEAALLRNRVSVPAQIILAPRCMSV
jgi:hypothetical protein